MGQWRSRVELEVLYQVAFVKCVWMTLNIIFFLKKEMIQRTELIASGFFLTSCDFKKKISVHADEESCTFNLCAKLAFYMDGGKSWGAFNNPLIHWGIQVVKRLSQMELGRAIEYVLSSESAVSMVKNDFCCFVWREDG